MKTPHVKVELAVLWTDHTRSDGHFEYIEAFSPAGNQHTLRALGDAACSRLEEKLKDNNTVCMIELYAIHCGGQYYSADGEPLDGVIHEV